MTGNQNLPYQEIVDILTYTSISDKEKLQIISKKYMENPKSFYDIFFNFTPQNIEEKFRKYLNSNSLEHKYKFLYKALVLTIELKLTLTGEFLFNFPEMYLTSLKLVDSDRQLGPILKNREIFGKTREINFFYETKLEITNLNPSIYEPLIVIAARNNNLEMVKLFIDGRADVNIVSIGPREYDNSDNKTTALSEAIKHENLELFNLLINHTEVDLSKSLRYIDKTNCSLRKNHKEFINNKTKEGQSLLHLAFLEGSIEDVQVLLKFGAKGNSRNNLGQTPFDYTINCLISRWAAYKADCYSGNLAPFQKLREIGFKEKTKILLKNFGTTYSDNHGLGNSRNFFDKENMMRNYPDFWNQFDLMLQSIIDELEQKKVADVLPNNIKLKIGHINDEKSKHEKLKS